MLLNLTALELYKNLRFFLFRQQSLILFPNWTVLDEVHNFRRFDPGPPFRNGPSKY